MTKPVACSLSGSELKGRLANLQELMVEAKIISDQKGEIMLALPPGRAEEVDHYAALESECCGFASFTTSHDEEGSTLTITSDSAIGMAVIRSNLKQVIARKKWRYWLAGAASLVLVEIFCVPVMAALAAVGSALWAFVF